MPINTTADNQTAWPFVIEELQVKAREEERKGVSITDIASANHQKPAGQNNPLQHTGKNQ